jgi:hypothetical protein
MSEAHVGQEIFSEAGAGSNAVLVANSNQVDGHGHPNSPGLPVGDLLLAVHGSQKPKSSDRD